MKSPQSLFSLRAWRSRVLFLALSVYKLSQMEAQIITKLHRDIQLVTGSSDFKGQGQKIKGHNTTFAISQEPAKMKIWIENTISVITAIFFFKIKLCRVCVPDALFSLLFFIMAHHPLINNFLTYNEIRTPPFEADNTLSHLTLHSGVARRCCLNM